MHIQQRKLTHRILTSLTSSEVAHCGPPVTAYLHKKRLVYSCWSMLTPLLLHATQVLLPLERTAEDYKKMEQNNDRNFGRI